MLDGVETPKTLKCPECGSSCLRTLEWLIALYPIRTPGESGAAFEYTGEASKVYDEDAEVEIDAAGHPTFHCDDCDHEWTEGSLVASGYLPPVRRTKSEIQTAAAPPEDVVRIAGRMVCEAWAQGDDGDDQMCDLMASLGEALDKGPIDGKTAAELDGRPAPEPADPWAEDPRYPLVDWRYEVANDDTRLGYREWARVRAEAAKEDRDG